jgi:hypothetical protein
MKIGRQLHVLNQAADLLPQPVDQKRINDEPYDRGLLHQAPRSISLLSDDHVQYCLTIKGKVNPKSQEFSLWCFRTRFICAFAFYKCN